MLSKHVHIYIRVNNYLPNILRKNYAKFFHVCDVKKSDLLLNEASEALGKVETRVKQNLHKFSLCLITLLEFTFLFTQEFGKGNSEVSQIKLI